MFGEAAPIGLGYSLRRRFHHWVGGRPQALGARVIDLKGHQTRRAVPTAATEHILHDLASQVINIERLTPPIGSKGAVES